MKRILLLATFAALLLTAGFAQSSKPKRGIIKYPVGNKYVGEILKVNPDAFNGKKKIRHGKGSMYYYNGTWYNGDRSLWLQSDGIWDTDTLRSGIIRSKSKIFEGEILYYKDVYGKGDGIEGVEYVGNGTTTYAPKSAFYFNLRQHKERWHNTDTCRFIGILNHKEGDGPYTGRFDCPLKTEDGITFIGEIADGHFKSGKIEYSNGDVFEGDFENDAPSSGKYRFGRSVRMKKGGYSWDFPDGCEFVGDTTTLTGTVNMEITDVGYGKENKFIGKLNNGEPCEGTMTNGYTGEKGTVASMRDKIDLRNFLSLNTKIFEPRYLRNLGKSGKRGAELFLVGKKVIYGGNTYVCKQIDFTGKFPALTISSQNKGDEILELNMLVKSVYPPDGLKKIDIGISIPQNLVTHEFVSFIVNGGRATLCLASDVQETVEFENRVKNYFIKKYGSRYGMSVLCGKIELGMTVEMVKEMKGNYPQTSNYVSGGMEITVLTYGEPPYDVTSYTFTNGRLTSFSSF